MKLRDLKPMQGPNRGSRKLTESVMAPEVLAAVKDWLTQTKNVRSVLIGGIALSYYVKPRYTQDLDVLFLEEGDIPTEVKGFRKHRPGAFEHIRTGVEIEVLLPQSINMPIEVAQAIYEHAKIEDGVRIASPSGLIVSKLGRFKLQDKADIMALYELGNIDLTPYPIPQEWKIRFDQLVEENK